MNTWGDLPRYHRKYTGDLQLPVTTYWLKITHRQFPEVPTPAIVIKQVEAMALSEKLSEGLVFDHPAGIAVDNIIPNDDANKAFREIEGNISGMVWETEPIEVKPTEMETPEANTHNNQYMPIADQYSTPAAKNNQYAPLAENNENDEDKDEITGAGEESTGVDIDNNEIT